MKCFLLTLVDSQFHGKIKSQLLRLKTEFFCEYQYFITFDNRVKLNEAFADSF